MRAFDLTKRGYFRSLMMQLLKYSEMTMWRPSAQRREAQNSRLFGCTQSFSQNEIIEKNRPFVKTSIINKSYKSTHQNALTVYLVIPLNTQDKKLRAITGK